MALIKLPYESHQVIDLELDDDEDVEAGAHDGVPCENDGQTKIIGSRPICKRRPVNGGRSMFSVTSSLKPLNAQNMLLLRCGRTGNDAMQPPEDVDWQK